MITQLVEMGFPMDACRKAVYYTGNSGAEAAMNWVMSHMDDPGMSVMRTPGALPTVIG